MHDRAGRWACELDCLPRSFLVPPQSITERLERFFAMRVILATMKLLCKYI